MPEIKNIIFDLGAVLIDIDFNRVNNSFLDLGISNFNNQYSQLLANKLFENLEMGKISVEDFYTAIQNQSSKPLQESDIKKAWNSIMGNFRIESMKKVQELSQYYNVFLLSNTNAIHFEEIMSIANMQLDAELDAFFKKTYYSFKIGMRKPNEDIYNYVLRDALIKAEETFFIDDTAPNIETAKRMGFITHLLLPSERVEQLKYYDDDFYLTSS